MLEERIVRFCAPTLAGLKTGNLFNTGNAPLACVKKELVLLLPELEKHGLSARLFLPAKKRALLYVYRVSALSRDLREPNTALFLQELGYDTQSPDAALAHFADIGVCTAKRIRHVTSSNATINVLLATALIIKRVFV